ncbi:MAG: glycosyltransferase family 2 protein [Gammaproteobacteria bacterium]|nr:glycosyltransferase family 2 protein [Gammaproteobacteria bacterium]
MKISLVVPVFNEEQSLPIFYNEVTKNLGLAGYTLELVFVNDGSQDATLDILKELVRVDGRVRAVDLTRNFGKEPALFAGLKHASGDVIIPMDVDLQDPVDVIPRMLERYLAGADIVLAKRVDRQSDSWLKRKTAEAFYTIHNKISSPPLEKNVGDFRLLSRQVVDVIIRLPERQLFMKGLFGWVGFNTAVVEYKRPVRVAGKTKFNGWRLWNLALEGITSFSTVPLKIWTYLGLAVSSVSFFYALIVIGKKLLFGDPVTGYASLMVAILFFGGVQLIGIGVLGEYIGRIYMETKQRPKYLVRKVYGSAVDDEDEYLKPHRNRNYSSKKTSI